MELAQQLSKGFHSHPQPLRVCRSLSDLDKQSLIRVVRTSATTSVRLALLEAASPSYFRRETGRLLKLLSRFPTGLTKEEMLESFYPGYKHFSKTRQDSLNRALHKVIQRARLRFNTFGLDIAYNKERKRWRISSTPS